MPRNEHPIQGLMDTLLTTINSQVATSAVKLQAVRDLAAAITVWNWVESLNEDPDNRDRSPRSTRDGDPPTPRGREL